MIKIKMHEGKWRLIMGEGTGETLEFKDKTELAAVLMQLIDLKDNYGRLR